MKSDLVQYIGLHIDNEEVINNIKNIFDLYNKIHIQKVMEIVGK
jgi:hypothetical protein